MRTYWKSFSLKASVKTSSNPGMAIRDGYICIMQINVADAKNRLPKLLRAICRRGLPVADLVPSVGSAAQKPQFGTMRGRVVIHDPDWWKPMTDEEADVFVSRS